MTATARLTGGCQCGAVRFACESLGRASICHCRMCQKALGSYFGPFVTAHGVTWTRGEPTYFRSSNIVRRGFCSTCGTPLTFEPDGGAVDIALGTFDEPQGIEPVLQLDAPSRIRSFDHLASLPPLPAEDVARFEERFGRVVSFQHPDHDTAEWPPTAPRPTP